MARGRFLSRALANSRRFSELDERSALVYAITYTYANVDGRLEVDGLSILAMMARFGLAHRYTIEDMDICREKIAATGLWKTYQADGRECAEIDKFFEHNKIRSDRESKGTIPGPTPDLLRSDSGVTPESATPKAREYATTSLSLSSRSSLSSSTPSVPSSVDRSPPPECPPKRTAARSYREGEPDRVIRCWTLMCERADAEGRARGLPKFYRPPADHFTATQVAAAGNSAEFPDEALVEEMRRIARIYEGKDWTITFKGVCMKIGQVFKGAGEDSEPVIWDTANDKKAKSDAAVELAAKLPKVGRG